MSLETTHPDDLEARLAGVVGQLNALHAELVDLVAEASATGAWHGCGIRSLGHWLTWKAGLSARHARQLVTLADAQHTHPRIMEAFADGELTLDQTAVAVQVPAHNDTEISELAKLCTVAQLHIIVRCSRPTTDPPPAQAPEESVSMWTDADGRFQLRGELDADHGHIVTSALNAARDRLFHHGHPTVTWVDALLELCHHSLDTETTTRRERFRINLFLDPTNPIPATWQDGTPVPDAIRRHLTCDGTLTPTFTTNGHPINVGTTQRSVPDRTRRAVLHRDRTCRVPWCTQTRWLQVHHIIHWEHGGRTDTDNLCALCPNCHRAHHHGELGITGNADDPNGLTYTNRHGRPLTAAPHTTKPTTPPPPPKHDYHHPLGEHLHTRSLYLSDPPNAPPPEAA